MLCLKVKTGEAVHIANSEIIVTVMQAESGYARLGIHADREIPIHREVIQQRIDHAEGRETKRVPPAEQNKAFFTPPPAPKKRKSS